MPKRALNSVRRSVFVFPFALLALCIAGSPVHGGPACLASRLNDARELILQGSILKTAYIREDSELLWSLLTDENSEIRKLACQHLSGLNDQQISKFLEINLSHGWFLDGDSTYLHQVVGAVFSRHLGQNMEVLRQTLKAGQSEAWIKVQKRILIEAEQAGSKEAIELMDFAEKSSDLAISWMAGNLKKEMVIQNRLSKK